MSSAALPARRTGRSSSEAAVPACRCGVEALVNTAADKEMGRLAPHFHLQRPEESHASISRTPQPGCARHSAGVTVPLYIERDLSPQPARRSGLPCSRHCGATSRHAPEAPSPALQTQARSRIPAGKKREKLSKENLLVKITQGNYNSRWQMLWGKYNGCGFFTLCDNRHIFAVVLSVIIRLRSCRSASADCSDQSNKNLFFILPRSF